MSTEPQFDVSTIFGTRGESLSLLLSTQNPNYTNVDVNLEIPNTLPPLRQQVATSTYRLPLINQLDALLDGNSEVVFEFSALNFHYQIYEHTWGARYAFITEGTITTIQPDNFAPWPKKRMIGDVILDDNPAVACLSFAFRCDYERLRVFQSQLTRALDAL